MDILNRFFCRLWPKSKMASSFLSIEYCQEKEAWPRFQNQEIFGGFNQEFGGTTVDTLPVTIGLKTNLGNMIRSLLLKLYQRFGLKTFRCYRSYNISVLSRSTEEFLPFYDLLMVSHLGKKIYGSRLFSQSLSLNLAAFFLRTLWSAFWPATEKLEIGETLNEHTWFHEIFDFLLIVH